MLDSATAWVRLQEMTAADSEPLLSEAELWSLFEQARRADQWGVAPDDASWEPTYDLNAAACRGWEMKAGKVAGEFQFETDGQVFMRHQKHRMCLEMADRYKRKINGTFALCFGRDTLTDIAGNVNSA
jgi:hypothetical protein